jgi:hypothetical protein
VDDDRVPGSGGSLGPATDNEYCQPHVYARDVQSGAGNCVCGGALGDDLHTEAAPGVPIPDTARAVCKAAEPQRYVLGIAYQAGPDPRIAKGADGGRDYFTTAELEKAAWSFLRNGPQVGLFHVDGTEGAATVVESYIYRGPDWDLGEGLVAKSGDWLVGAILDDRAWRLHKDGKLNGWSPQGTARRRRQVTPARDAA